MRTGNLFQQKIEHNSIDYENGNGVFASVMQPSGTSQLLFQESTDSPQAWVFQGLYRETAAMIYRKAALKNLVRGRSIQGVTAASLYAACRQCHVPRTLDEISLIAQISRKEIGRNYRYVSRELALKLMPTTPKDYISRFCSELKLSSNVQAKTLEILGHAVNQELTSGRGPTGLAAASLYISSVLCGERRTQREVAEIAGVTEVTIRNRYKELAQKLDIHIVM